jgi:methylated-DNA-[protein]-cysteine S-methyltransferase
VKKIFVYENSLVGRIAIAEEDGYITNLVFLNIENIDSYFEEAYIIEDTQTIKIAKQQLDEYFLGTRTTFSLPIKLAGSEFQMKVWEALAEIPYGETRSYKQIGERIGNPKASRAVGHANNRNPVSIIIPCHRVIGSNGQMVGYGGGLDIKEQLHALEKSFTLK